MNLNVKIRGVEYVEMLEQPVSPTGQYFNSSVLSVSIIAVLEFDNPIDDSSSIALINDIFIPINPRFSSIMVEDKEGGKHWKRVEVKVEDHIIVPKFPEELIPESYDNYFSDYLSKMAMDPLPQTKPLWEIHVIKYPTTSASGSIVFKLHHALGDGFSLMGALLSSLERADNPSLPLTFPNFRKARNPENEVKSFITVVRQGLSGALNTIFDFGWTVLKSGFLEDSPSPIRSGEEGVEFKPINITTITYSLDQMKQIKSCLQVTINDVVCGIIFMGTRLYMKETTPEETNARSTALVLTNTRSVNGYKSVNEMVRNQEAKSLWGNQFGFMHVSLPNLLQNEESFNPLKFVKETHNIIKRKKNSSDVYLTGMLLEFVKKYRGPKATAEYIHKTLKNSSMALVYMVGPLEKMSLSNQQVKGLYFMVVNVPQSLTVTVTSYMDQLRVAIATEKGLIDPMKFQTCMEKAFNMMFGAAVLSKI